MRPYPSLRPVLRRRLSQFAGSVRQRLRANAWFPHAPLAVVTALLGLFNFLPAVGHVMKSASSLSGIGAPILSLPAVRLAIDGFPQGMAGAVLVAMSIGLILRSRLAWTITLILAAATLAMILHRGAVGHGDLAVFNGVVLAALLLFRRSFSRSSLAAATLFTVVSVTLLFAYAGFGAYVLGSGFSPPITTLPAAFYFAVVTMSTVGYGDIVPKSGDARLFVSSIIILDITVFATSISAVLVPMINRRMQQLLAGEKKRMILSNHYIVVGDTSLAHSTYRELKARHLPVTVILAREADTDWLDRDDAVWGDATDLEILRKAGAQDAIAVLALRADDRENAFIIMALKELGAKAHTVAAVKDSKNLERVRRVGPDMIIAPDIIGGELLAMALSGEDLDGDALLRKMFHVDAKGQG